MTDREQSVVGIFMDFFGEDRVDFDGQWLIVHFPHVTVTNEYNRSIDITHLWVRIRLCSDGTLSGFFGMTRSEYTEAQLLSGYCHSHVPQVYIRDRNSFLWKNPCLGTGPIRGTIASLSSEFSEDIWRLFCVELQRYVSTESLSGGPYIRLETVGTRNNKWKPLLWNVVSPTFIRRNIASAVIEFLNTCFLPSVISDMPFGFNYTNGCYGIAMSPDDIMVTLSNLFIKVYNSTPKERQIPVELLSNNGILFKGIKKDNRIYRYVEDEQSYDLSSINGMHLLTFKGNPVTLNITDIMGQEEDNTSVFLEIDIVKYVVNKILYIINSKYGKPEDSTSEKEYRYL